MTVGHVSGLMGSKQFSIILALIIFKYIHYFVGNFVHQDLICLHK